MKKSMFFTLLFLAGSVCFSQNSILVNFGSNTCVSPNQPSFSLIKNPLGPAPTVLNQCNMGNQLPNFFAVFVAYNPKDNNIYIADIRTFTQSRIWRLDVGLPEGIACPANIPATPTFTHNYVSNNFEFDNNGDLWSFSAFDVANGRCNLDKFDVVTGNVINTRVLQFPVGNFPSAITSGDLCILPNGRMFATLGDNPSRLYEIENYTAPNITAQAKFLRTLPKNCYGIAYLNGLLEVTGTNLSNSCYYFTYDFANDILSEEKPFQNGQAPIDNTSITPTIGATKRLAASTLVNANTADLTYEVYVRNMGNTILNDVNITEDLGKTFGSGNISNVTVSFVQGSNVAGLTLNPSYNGTTVTQILLPNQSLPNQTATNTSYFFAVRISCRVTNLLTSQVYLNSAVATATINNEVDRIFITDSSNNGLPEVIDPNNNVNPTETGENVPSPFDFRLLPVKFLSFDARLSKPMLSSLRWQIAVPAGGADYFEVQWSTDAVSWIRAGVVPITNNRQGHYTYSHEHASPPELFYRIRQVDKDGQFIYSPVIRLNSGTASGLTILPNPASDFITIQSGERLVVPGRVALVDAAGRVVLSRQMNGRQIRLSVASLPPGIYRVVFAGDKQIETKQILIIR